MPSESYIDITPIVHIGFQKTATTYLQKNVFSNKDYFQQPWGAQPPKAIEYFVLEHPDIFNADYVRKVFIQDMDIDTSARPVISHEDLSGYPIYAKYYLDRVTWRLHQTFPSLRLIVGIREQAAMLKSQYFQYVRQGGTESIGKLLKNSAMREGYRPTIRLEHFEYDRTIRYLMRFFKIENILVLPLELLQKSPDIYIDKLMGFCGIGGNPTFNRGALLKKRPDILMNLERQLNRIFPSPTVFPEHYKDTPLSYRGKKRVLRSIEPIVRGRSFLERPDNHITNVIDQVTDGYYGCSNRRLTEMTGLDLASLGYDLA